MPHLVDSLRTLLRGKAAPTSGVVEAVSGAQVRVRTSRGIESYPGNGFTLSAGDTVRLGVNGVTGVSAPVPAANVYDL